MSDTKPFDMPPASASFEARGGWLLDQLMAEPSLGFTNIIHPAAIVGNLGGESGLQAVNEKRPTIPGSRGGWGWAQWTGEGKGRRGQFERYCADNGYDISSDEGQYKFLVWELLNTENHSLQQLKKTTELEAAVYTFCVQFERPSDPQGGLPSRIRFAERALAFPRRQDSQPDEIAPAPLPAPTPEADDDLQKDVRRALEILIPEIVKTLQAVLKASGQPKSRSRPADLGSGVAALRNCPHCGQPFKVGPGGRRSDARFCSTEHQMAFKSLQRSRKESAK